MKSYKLIVSIAVACCCFSAHSQQFPVDVAIRAELSAPLPWVLGSTHELRLIVQNRSDRDTRGIIRQQILTAGLQDAYNFLAESCRRNADCEQFGTICYETPIIMAGAEARCVLTLRPIQLRGQDYFTRFTYRDLVAPHFDPDLSNNSTDVRITLVSVPVTQVPLSPLSYGLMGLLMLGLGGFVVRRS